MSQPSPAPVTSPWSPLRHPTFRALWIATLASNIGTWLQSVGAAWLMTSLTPSSTMVALVQAATSLPMFLLSLPAGALADVLDRRRILLVTQSWMLLSAAALGLLTAGGYTTPWVLLLLTTSIGLGAALNQPAWQASLPELVPREDLAPAIALGSIGFNIARALGPALGGLIVASAGAGANFLLNAASFLGVLVVLYRWKRPPRSSVLPAERFFGAMRTGVRFVRHSPEVLAVIVRGSLFVLCASSLWALLPVVARNELGRGAAGYGLLLTALGIGAVASAMVLPRLSRKLSTDLLVAAASLVFAGGIVALGYLGSFWLLFAAMLAAGGAWMVLLSSLNVAIQTLVPSWVRGRALSVYMLFIFGGLAGGSALWGAVAERVGVSRSLLFSAIGLVLGLLATFRIHLKSGEGLNLAPSRQWPAPMVSQDLEPDQGPVLVMIEYRIDPDRFPDFAAAIKELRRVRLRGGAMQWGLFADSEAPGVHTEMFLVSSWMEHMRQHERITIADEEIRLRVGSFHLGPEPPAVRHLLAEHR